MNKLVLFLSAVGLASCAAAYESKRPEPAKRCFTSAAVEKTISRVQAKLGDTKMAWLFANCFPNTLDTTVQYSVLENGDDDTFVYTGDIHAMWLRDSAAQVWPYLRLAKDDEPLRRLIRGVVLRQFMCIRFDPYANAFNRNREGGRWQEDLTDMKPELHERKYELDSLCYPIRLAHGYWKATGDATIFDARWQATLDAILRVMREQQRKEGPCTSYQFRRKTTTPNDTLSNGGYGWPVKPCGLIASAFRPSDDATIFPFLVPSNFFAVDVLRKAAEILRTVNGDEARAAACTALADEVETALYTYAVFNHPKYGKVFAFEVDGYGNALFIDDANVPSLLALPYFSAVRKDDPIYLNTRKLVWGRDNPYYFEGKAGAGIGGPHCGLDRIWPMSYVLRALTTDDEAEIQECLAQLEKSDAGTGFMHESYNKDDPAKFSRSWFAWANTLFGELILNLVEARERTADLVVYGSSPAAVSAAIKATDMGLKAVIVSPARHVGGLSVSGLGFTDSGNTSAIGGLARDFYRRIYRAYQQPEAWTWQRREDFKAGGQDTKAMNHEEGTMWTFEPHIAERVFAEWMAERKVEVRRGEFLDREKGVVKRDGRIVSIRTLSGNTYSGRYFIDATYEGDLMAAAGVPYRVGREDCAEFGETWNGNQVGVLHHRHHFRDWKISPYRVPGDPSSGLCAEIDPAPPGVRGAGDRRVQAYCYRMCLTDDPRNRIPFAKPDGYDPARYELLGRCYAKGYAETFAKFDRIANHKTDTNNHGPLNADWLGGSTEWPEASYARRAELAKAHKDYQMGLYCYLSTDPAVPEDVRAAMAKWGLAKDEFVDNGGWPYEIYVREGRRMIGEYTMTEHDCLGDRRHPAQGRAYGPVGMGSYCLDSHNVRRYVTAEGYVQNEGDIGVDPKAPYGIDYGAIVPRKADCENLLVPVALSATHTAFGSIRMEPVFMLLGESAATAAAFAARDGRAVQDVAYPELAERLRADGQVLDLQL